MIQTFALRLSVSVLLDSKLLHLLFVDVSWEWVVFWSLYIYAACGNGVVGLSFSLTGPKTQEQETTCCPGQSECQGFSVPRVHLSALTPTTAFHSVFVRPESIHPVDTWLDLWSDWTFRLVVCCHTRPALRSRRCVCVCVCVCERVRILSSYLTPALPVLNTNPDGIVSLLCCRSHQLPSTSRCVEQTLINISLDKEILSEAKHLRKFY